jgi:glycosyltransferase involved in cell wall biosynthesis
MRIGILSTFATRVSHDCGGSIEQLVWLLARELTALGHDVTVFAADGSDLSRAGARFVATLPGTYARDGSPYDWQLCEWVSLCRAVERSGAFDVMHAHAYLWSLPLGPLARCPIVHTMHIQPDEDHARLRALYPRECVTAISAFQWREFAEHAAPPPPPPPRVIHHGINADDFPFDPAPGDYLCYLGRFIPGKGALHAIAAARQAKMPLLLAGPESDYYHQHVAPHVDGARVRYVGFVTGGARSRLLGGARALLYPVETPEPFGLVMPEAMMCGTPVVATRCGAVPEIVDDGVTGCLVGAADELADRIGEATRLDRRRIREVAGERFSASRMAREYADVYQRLVDGHEPGGP